MEPAYRVTINRIHYNPPGKDVPAKLNQEYIIVENKGDEKVSLAGWMLLDKTGTGKRRHVYTFPKNVSILQREQIYLYTGRGKNSFSKGKPPRWNIYWGRRRFVWNNEGDLATLLDNNGNVVDSLQVVPLKPE